MVDEVNGMGQIQINGKVDQNKPLQTKGHNAGVPAEKKAVNNADQVSLTDRAKQLRLLQQQIADQPVVDSQRVESIKRAIADGDFQIDVNKTAEKMIGLEQLLQGAMKKE